ncbi:MAG: type 3 dihydrofolate reductase [bacterium]|nr:type 3 dihydrofolate reductase [bacterium]
MLSIISALAENRVIGNKNTLPWHLPADFKYFKETTLNKTIVMGLNTFKSIGSAPLPNRKNIILNDDLSYVSPDDCYVVHSINELLEMVRNEDEVMICGGASVYKQFLPLANRLYLTYIHQNFEGDTYFPEFDVNDWEEISRTDHKPDEKNLYSYSFVVLDRK